MIEFRDRFIAGEEKLAHLIFALYLLVFALSLAALFRKLEQPDVITVGMQIVVSGVMMFFIVLSDFTLSLPVKVLSIFALIMGVSGVVLLHIRISQPQEKMKNDQRIQSADEFFFPDNDADAPRPWL